MKTAAEYIEAVSKYHRDYDKLRQIDLEFQPVYNTLSLKEKKYITEEIFKLIDESMSIFQSCVKKEMEAM